jgi:hypothetical protein
MPRDGGARAQGKVPLDHVEVGAAHATSRHLDEDLVGTRDRVGDLGQCERPGGDRGLRGEEARSHGAAL